MTSNDDDDHSTLKRQNDFYGEDSQPVVPAVSSENQKNNNNTNVTTTATLLGEDTTAAIDDKSILRKAYDLIDRTARSFRRYSTTLHELDDEREFVPSNANDAATGPSDDDVDHDQLILAPVVARAKAKAASAYLADNNGGKQGSNKRASLVPGAEYVPSRAPGLRPEFYLRFIRRDNWRRGQKADRLARQELNVDDTSDWSNQGHDEAPEDTAAAATAAVAVAAGRTIVIHEIASVSHDGRNLIWAKSYRFCIIVIGVGCTLIAAAVGLGIGLGLSNNNNNDKPPAAVTAVTSRFSPFTLDCSTLKRQVNPHVVSQCYCYETVSTLANTTFMATIGPDFHEALESCDPRNQALLWLASADGGTNTSALAMRQRYSLAIIFLKRNGPHWTSNDGWLSSQAECLWIGVACRPSDERRRWLDIFVTGTYNKTTVPTIITGLSMSRNRLKGSLSTELGNVVNLTSIDLKYNQLIGTLRTELGQLSLLNKLKLGYNKLSGAISTWIGQFAGLQTLSLTNNTFTPAPIPTEIGLLTQIQHIRLATTGLIGTVPKELFKLGNTLQAFDASGNSIERTISTHFGNLTALSELHLDGNNLTGTIPVEFFHCNILSYLSLSDNQLHGTVPIALGLLSNLTSLYLDGNNLSGSIPQSICEFTTPFLCPTSHIKCSCCVCK